MRHPLERRAQAAQKTMNRFIGKKFQWGRNDCARLTAFHLRAVNKPVKVAKAGTYHSAVGGAKALKRLGYDNLREVADAHFERITPAAAIVGDLIELKSDSPLGCITVVLGNGRVCGWIDGHEEAVVMQPNEYEAAWRVL